MKISKTELENVLEIEPEIFEDFRGNYIETYNKKLFHELGIYVDFVADDFGVSLKNVLRGIHGDSKTWKLTTCLYGKVYSVVIDCREGSDTFGKWQAFSLSEDNHKLLLIPPSFGNSFLVLSDFAIYFYKQSEYYKTVRQFTYKWNDPKFKIFWPIKDPILSERDE